MAQNPLSALNPQFQQAQPSQALPDPYPTVDLGAYGFLASPKQNQFSPEELANTNAGFYDDWGSSQQAQPAAEEAAWWQDPKIQRALAGGIGALAGYSDRDRVNQLLYKQAGRVNADMARDRASHGIPAHMADGGSPPSLQHPVYQDMPDPSILGWLQYLANGSDRIPTHRVLMPPPPTISMDAQGQPSRSVIDTIRDRNARMEKGYAEGGLSRYVRGGTTGQSDKIPAMLSDGEFVMDADTVSALGDGNNEAGAEKLDQMRQAVRGHKRSAPVSQIPPKAKNPLAYLKKGK